MILASIIRISNLWINGRLAADIGSDLSCESYMRTLFQPYEFHLKTRSSTVISNITSQIGKTVLSINAFLQLITSAVIATALLIGLLIIDAPIAIVSVALFGLAYSLLAATAKRELSTNGKK